MARIYIEPEKARRATWDEQSLEKKLTKLSGEVDSVKRNLRYKIAGQEQISEQLRQVVEQIAQESNSTKNLRDALDQIVNQYVNTENSNRENEVADKTSSDTMRRFTADVAKTLREGILGRPHSPLSEGWTGAFSAIAGILPYGKLEYKSTDGNYEEEVKGIDSAKYKKTVIHPKEYGSKFYIDGKTGKIIKVDPNDKEESEEFSKHNKLPVDVRLAGVGTSASARIWGAEGELNGNVGGLEYSVDVLKAERHADAYVGMLSVGATVGASVTAFSAEGKAYLGNDDRQLYVKGGVTVGKVGTEAGGSVGLLDKDGKFNPNAYVGAKAEAIGGEISGTVGGKIAGADVSATGSLNYGIGAHANVGIHDGKISVDVGATLGVGGSIKVDIDVSGTVSAVAEKAQNAWSAIKGWF